MQAKRSQVRPLAWSTLKNKPSEKINLKTGFSIWFSSADAITSSKMNFKGRVWNERTNDWQYRQKFNNFDEKQI